MSSPMHRYLCKQLGLIPHAPSRHTVPVKKNHEPSVCVRQGNPEFPCFNNYAGRRNESEDEEETKGTQSES